MEQLRQGLSSLSGANVSRAHQPQGATPSNAARTTASVGAAPAPTMHSVPGLHSGFATPAMTFKMAGNNSAPVNFGRGPVPFSVPQPPGASAPTRASLSTATTPQSSKKRSHPAAFPSEHPKVQVKKENVDYSRNPRDPIEMHLFAQLQQMGFTDAREILHSVRSLRENNPGPPPSTDSVMIDIISRREEAEEAKKMDAARLLSEQARKEESKRRRLTIENAFEKRLRQVSLECWRREEEMFCSSWILEIDFRTGLGLSTLCENNEAVKFKLLELLKLEKKAQKWYRKIASEYFSWRVIGRLRDQTTTSSMLMQLQREVESLEKAMFTLSEQTNGVPRILINAHDEHKKQNGLNRGEADSSDDEVVVVVQAAPNRGDSVQRAPPEVVEIP